MKDDLPMKFVGRSYVFLKFFLIPLTKSDTYDIVSLSHQREGTHVNQFIVALDNFFSATAWEMVKPKAYGPFHLTFTFVGLLLCIFRRVLRCRLGLRILDRILV